MKKLLFFLVFGFQISFAHSLWVNSFESYSHQGHHSLVGLGWGHNLPMGDILNGVNGKVDIKSFSFYDTNLNKYPLYKPEFVVAKPSLKNENFNLYKADLATQKIEFNKSSKEGVYQLEAVTKAMYYTMFLDKKNRKRMKLKPKDAIKDLKTSLGSFRYQAYAKSFICKNNKWSNPKKLHHDLEIIPTTSLCDLHVGDKVAFFVSSKEKPLTTSPQGMEFATFWSDTYGQSDDFKIISYIRDGKAGFRIPAKGHWVMNVYHTQNITKDGKLKEFYGKADKLMNAATISFTVK